MAIEVNRDHSDDAERLQITLNNGDLKAFDELVQAWKFKDQASALRFAIAVLTLTRDGTLMQDKGGDYVALKPKDDLLVQR